jgi:hypothetical protein
MRTNGTITSTRWSGHVVAHTLDDLAFHGEGFMEGLADSGPHPETSIGFSSSDS